jgi:hypothetical protein
MRRRITLGVLAAVALLAAAGIVAAARNDSAAKPRSEKARELAAALKSHTAPVASRRRCAVPARS